LELLYEFRKEALKEVFEDLKAPLPISRTDIASEEFLSPQEMAKFYLVLYNGSYLRKTDSEEALEILSKAKYKDGLVAGVPSDVVVSHKYGERKVTIANGDVHNEFHDCGIIYYTKNPYKLCVMTKGQNLEIEKASKIIAKLSRIVYENVATGK
jgi:beta-lactamase class A